MLWMEQEQSQLEGHALAPQENGLRRHFPPKSPDVRPERHTPFLCSAQGNGGHTVP